MAVHERTERGSCRKNYRGGIRLCVIKNGNKYLQALKTALLCRRIGFSAGFAGFPIYPKLSALFLFLLGCKNIYGYTGKNFIAKLLMTEPPFYEEKEHLALLNLRLSEPKAAFIPQAYYPKFDKKQIKTYVPKNNGPYVMVEVSNNRVTSQLGLEKTANILNRTFEKIVFSVLVTGKPTDKGKAETLRASLTMSAETFFTRSLDEFIGYVDSADIVMVGDGGIGHIAGALDKRIVALYAGTSIARWGILGGKVAYLYDRTDVNAIEDSLIEDALKEHLKALMSAGR